MKGVACVKKINIVSIIEELDDSGLTESSERTEVSVPVEICEVGGLTTLSYTEESEGQKCDSLITLKGDEITVRRSGSVESEFVFTEKGVHKSLYKVPPYSFDTEIFTKKIRNNLTRGIGNLTILYDMTIGGGKKRVNMKITVSEVAK
jgi:uncharacterized beta-barrel protein YwiB (DUF1934 family)